MTSRDAGPVQVGLLAVPESSASVLYGLYDVLRSVGRTWSSLTGESEDVVGFDVRIVARSRAEFRCDGGVPVAPRAALREVPRTDVVVVSDLAVDMDTDPRRRWPEEADWVRAQYAAGALICTVCTGSLLLADTGLLDGQEATSHWAAAGLFRTYYPAVGLKPQRVVLPAGPEGRIVTTGGAASWEDLSLHLVRRFCGEAEAVRTAKIFLLGDRSEGQLPFAAMTRPRRHDDAAIADCQVWIADHYGVANPVSRMVARSGLAERTFKRRFLAATGYAPVEYVQALRVEEAKQYLETTGMPTDEVAAAIGYEDPAFFRRLFKRHTGITPARYRNRFRSVGNLAEAGRTCRTDMRT
ncbi:MAG TPA: helix-turn-helix domain-containing protein [Arenibaculum sp.]|nr:helix-turn-helix domain-containing protein [Arenibaculum sp.]